MARLILPREINRTTERETKRILCFEDGNVIIKLNNKPEQALLLHSSFLTKASTYFAPAAKEEWIANSKNVKDFTHLVTGQQVKVYTYYLVYNSADKIVLLDARPDGVRDEFCGEGLGWGCSHERAYPFHLSKDADGFLPRSTAGDLCLQEVRESSSHEHRALFALLYKVKVDLFALSHDNLANILAYAQLYDLLDFVAVPIRMHLLERADLWEDIRNYPHFHLALAIKLRCTEVYCDALRHLIGSGADLSILTEKLDFDSETALAMVLKREQLRSSIDSLTKDIQALMLHTYISHTDKPGKAVTSKTTYLASTFNPADRFHRCADIARCIISEWLTLHMCGKKHWSHVRHEQVRFDSDTNRNGTFYERYI